MWTGQQTLKSINEALRSAGNDIERLDKTLGDLSLRLSNNQCDQTKVCEGLAGLRLDELNREKTQSFLNHADSLALAALEKREKIKQQLENDIVNLNQQLSQLDLERDRQAEIVNEHSQVLIDCEQLAQGELEADSLYQQQLLKAQQADAIADRSEEKTTQAEEDRINKGKPFESDSFFMYLWQRHYGQPEYKANFLARFLDAWVARLCDFNQSRVNYWMLLELPKRLAFHAETVRKTADNELLELEKIEQAFAEKHGVIKAQEALTLCQNKIDEIDKNIELAEAKQHTLLAEKTDFNTGQDPLFKQAINEISSVMQRKDIIELQRLSNRTLAKEDDHLVSTMIDLREEENDLQQSINQTRQLQQEHLAKLNELKKVRQNFKSKRFDDVRSGFNNGSLIGVALNEFLKGVLNNGELWRIIERSQRHRDIGAWPDFGSGGLGRGSNRRSGRRSSPWHWPGRSSGGGGFRLPRSGGSSSRGRGSGGFRTGGGF